MFLSPKTDVTKITRFLNSRLVNHYFDCLDEKFKEQGKEYENLLEFKDEGELSRFVFKLYLQNCNDVK